MGIVKNVFIELGKALVMEKSKRLGYSLSAMRITVFLVFFMWTPDKIIRPEHASKVYESFYFFPAMGALIFYGIGSL